MDPEILDQISPVETSSCTSPQEVEQMYRNMIQVRVEQCNKEIAKLLHKHNCRLDVEQMVRNGVPGPTQIVVVTN